MKNKKKQQSHISSKLIFVFSILVIVVVLVNSLAIYYMRSNAYKEQSIDSMKQLGSFLGEQLENEGETFLSFQEYMLDNHDKVYIPVDFDKDFISQSKYDFERAFSERYPGKAFGEDICFDDMDDDLKVMFCTYYEAYWFLYFEDISDNFNVPVACYCSPSEGTHVIYIFDVERLPEDEEIDDRLHLFDDYEEDYDDCPHLFETWEAGEPLDEMDEFDNEYGYSYTYYIPVYIEGIKVGLVFVDMDINYVNGKMLADSFSLSIMSGIILALGLILCCIYINRFIVSRVVHLSKNVGVYKRMKDGGVASDLMASNRGNDEISELYTQTASMIEEINEYVENLKNTTKQLSEAREQATHDALTGIRNKNAYDIEIMSIEADIQKGSYYYGIVMVDMNYLKNLNDNYGHDIGNLAIRKLCRLICLTFEHSPVFRVGGDEFVVLLKGYDYQHIVQLADKFNQNIETIASDDDLKDWERISAALGYALFDPDRDRNMSATFARADQAMYERKKQMKAGR